MSIINETLAAPASRVPLTRALSLPHEVLQIIVSSIANLETSIYSLIPGQTNTSAIHEEFPPYTQGKMHIILRQYHRHILGLSSESNWLTLVLSRHPFHLTRHDKAGISAVVTQALRRMNARIERLYWSEGFSTNSLQITSDLRGADSISSQPAGLHDQTNDEYPDLKPVLVSMKQYHATMRPEEEICSQEPPTRPNRAQSNAGHVSSPSKSLISYCPVPIVKLRHEDIIHTLHQRDLQKVTQQMSALLVAVLIALVQCRIILLDTSEKLDRDTVIPSIESCETRDSTTLKLHPRPDRTRSLSGSTVAESLPHEMPLSFLTISTVCISNSPSKQMKRAEKRVTEEKADAGLSPKRPKLSEYKQVSSGRVASLMDRFEKFHI